MLRAGELLSDASLCRPPPAVDADEGASSRRDSNGGGRPGPVGARPGGAASGSAQTASSCPAQGAARLSADSWCSCIAEGVRSEQGLPEDLEWVLAEQGKVADRRMFLCKVVSIRNFPLPVPTVVDTQGLLMSAATDIRKCKTAGHVAFFSKSSYLKSIPGLWKPLSLLQQATPKASTPQPRTPTSPDPCHEAATCSHRPSPAGWRGTQSCRPLKLPFLQLWPKSPLHDPPC